jgi:hypothetical protein
MSVNPPGFDAGYADSFERDAKKFCNIGPSGQFCFENFIVDQQGDPSDLQANPMVQLCETFFSWRHDSRHNGISIMGLFATLSIKDIHHNSIEFLYAECRNAKCQKFLLLC